MRTYRFVFTLLIAVAASLAGAAGCDGETDEPIDGVGGTGEPGTGGTAACPGEQTLCSEACVSLDSDRDNCGECGNACDAGNLCFESDCVVSCPGELGECAGTCADFQRDDDNCGSCGNACDAGEACFEGACIIDCPADLLECDGTCVDPLSNSNYCGASACDDVAGMGGMGPDSAGGEVCGSGEICIAGECREFVREWATGTRVDTAPQDVGFEQSIGIDAEGNAAVVWRQKIDQDDEESYRAFAANYDASTRSWGEPVRLDPTNNSLRVRNLAVSVGPSGHAVAVWVQGNEWDDRDPDNPANQDNLVVAAVYDPVDEQWSSTVKVSTPQGDPARDSWAFAPSVAVDGEGKALVVWRQLAPADTAETMIHRAFRSHFADGVFSTPATWPTQKDGSLLEIALDTNRQGDAVVIWPEELVPLSSFSRTPVATMGTIEQGTWSTPTNIRVDDTILATNTDVAIDGDGDVMAVWNGADSNSGSLQRVSMARLYTGVWGTETAFEDSNEDADYRGVRVAMDEDGDATMAMELKLNSDREVIATRYDFSEGTWSATEAISAVITKEPAPKISADGRGNVFVGWVSEQGARSSRYDVVQQAWVGPITLSSSTGVANSPTIAAARSGNAFVAWVQDGDDDRSHLFAGSYD